MRKLALMLTLTFASFYSAGNATIDSLKVIVKTTNNDTTRYRALYKLAISHLDSAYSVSIDYWDQAIDLAKRKRLWIMAADAYHQKGYMLYKKGELLNGLNNFKEALTIYEQVNGEKEMGEVLNDIGLVYRTWGKYELAIDNYQTALKIFSKIQYDEGIGMASNNIGQIYFYRNDFLKAIDYFKKYLEINQKLKYSRAVAAASNNIATAYMELGSYDLAYTFYYKSLLIYDSLKINLGVAIIQDNIGSLYFKKNQINDAILYHTQALKTFSDLGNQSYQSNTLKNIGLAYFKLSKFETAKSYYLKSVSLAEKLNKAETKKEVYYNLAEVYERTGQFKEALSYYKNYLQVNDSLLSVETAEKLANLESKLDKEQQTTNLDQLKKELSNINTYLKVSIAILLLFLPIIGLLIILYSRARTYIKKLQKETLAYSKIEYLYPVCQNNILHQLNIKLNLFYQWYSAENPIVRFGVSAFYKQQETVIVLWQMEPLAENVFHKILAIEGSVTNEIEQMQNIQPNNVLAQFNSESSNDYSATHCISFNHSSGQLTYSINAVVFYYTQATSSLKDVNNEKILNTNKGDSILLVSLPENEKLPADFIVNLESILQKHGNEENESLKQSLNGLFEMLEMSHPSIQPARFVFIKP